jgi:Holliday junction resolvase RusA-like endonuclease
MYNVKSVREWKAAVKTAAFLASREQQVDVPVPAGTSVTAVYKFYLPWSKGTPKYKAETIADHTEKPDLKNLLSHTEDALSEANIWTDDNQVDEIAMRKWRVPRGTERTEVVISW